jgi:hypothetical protein
MLIFSFSTFVISIFGLSLLFAIKFWEEKKGIKYCPNIRLRADENAINIKKKIYQISERTEDFPQYILLTSRIILHSLVVGFAKIAGTAEKGAHKIADLVSHKRRFEHRTTSSSFLKQVSEHKSEMNGNAKPAVKKTAKKKVARKRVGKKN